MKKGRRRFRLPIQRRLFLFSLFITALPLLLFGAFLYSQMVRLLQNEAENSARRELLQLADRMSLDLTQIKSTSNLIYRDEAFSDYLDTYTEKGREAADLRYNLADLIQRYNIVSSSINFRVALVAKDGSVFGNLLPNQDGGPRLEESAWYESLESRPSNILWVSDERLDKFFSTTGYPYVYLVRRLQSFESPAPTGTLILAVPELDIKKMYSGYVGGRQSIYLLDAADRLISHEDNLGMGAEPGLPAGSYAGYSGTLLRMVNGERQLVSYHTINATQWKVVILADMDDLLSSFSWAFSAFAVILGLYFILTIFLCSFMARHFVRPISTLHEGITRVQEGDLNVLVPVTTNDEVGDVSIQFNHMLEEIRKLMDRVLQEQKQKRDAEMAALQTQISPHFLYNTLASIRFLVYSGDREAADSAILSLIRLLKNSLSDHAEFVTVGREMSLLNDYISIQRLTLARPVDIVIQVEEEIFNCKMIKFLLQPVVENAFLHGLKPKKGDCRLAITGRSRGGAIEFIVEDNGVGFDPESVNFVDADRRSQSVGLCNVHNRILLTFGEGYGVMAGSEPGGGARITLRIPRIINEGEYSSYEYTDR